MKTIDNYNFSGKKALIRVDFNVPLDADFKVTDDTRIVAAVPTIKKVLKDGGSVILMSHLGRPKNGHEEKFSLKHIVKKVAEITNHQVLFSPDCMGEETAKMVANLKAGEILLLENLRFYSQETKGDISFAEKLSTYGDVYVNDAFGTAHRAHSSTTIVAQFFPNNKMFGYLIEKEIKSVAKVLTDSEKPVTAIVGGAKVSSKIIIIENLLNKVDHLIIGGGMAYTFIKAQGGKIGNSLVENDFIETAKEILDKAKSKNVTLLLPQDSVVANDFNNDAEQQVCATNSISDGWMGMDIGEKAIKDFSECILNSKTILWNGPVGVFEMKNFENGTLKIAQAIVAATKKGAFSLVGGGDSVAAINKFNLAEQVSHVSTGGGAMLEYLEGKELPGIAAILND
ncbi:MAG: phosphoglycerate kinase [Bacteroidetes bacterium RIFCSPLOWO2_12_FULL_31_6]|nr:MAG: phosphoglycerate kinase [Bacteroidetes bacterium RIFCSPLOWO2_12_FULL_31_6]